MKLFPAAILGASVLALAFVIARPAAAGQKGAKELTTDQTDVLAGRVMDAFEELLMELPTDKRVGVSRMVRVVAPVHKGTKGEINYKLVEELSRFYSLSAHAAGRFDSKGIAGRVRTGSLAPFGMPRVTDSALEKKVKAIEARVKTDSKTVYLSGKKDLKTWGKTNGQPVTIYSRAIMPKKECLSCHTEAKMGKTMGVAAFVLERREIKQPIRRP